MSYLTEKKLKEILDSSDYKFIHNKKFFNENFRPDFVCHDLKLIIEFDGYQHYNNSKTQSRDFKKYQTLSDKYPDWASIRIPYFIQLTKEVYDNFFGGSGLDIGVDENILIKDYPHGFIDKKALTPVDFNAIGWNLFLYQMASNYRDYQYEVFDSFSDDIVWMYENSLKKDIMAYPMGYVESGFDINGALKHFNESNFESFCK